MTHRPAVVAFDVIETLMSLEPLRERLTEIGQPAHMLEAWYTRTLRDGMALSATGDFVPFTDVAESALRGLTGYTVSDEQVAQVMAGFSELPAFPDALPAMTTLNENGVRVACLTNGSAYLTSSFLNRTGLGSLVDRVISVGEVFRWKPSQMVYLYAAEVLDVPPQWLALVAAHDWDCHGAKRAGLITGWVSRKSGGFGAPFEPPDVVGEDLTEVAANYSAWSSAERGRWRPFLTGRVAGRAAYWAAGDALAVQDRGDPALADAEAHGALVQAQPLVPVGGRDGPFVEVAAWAADLDALGGQELHDRRTGHAEHRARTASASADGRGRRRPRPPRAAGPGGRPRRRACPPARPDSAPRPAARRHGRGGAGLGGAGRGRAGAGRASAR